MDGGDGRLLDIDIHRGTRGRREVRSDWSHSGSEGRTSDLQGLGLVIDGDVAIIEGFIRLLRSIGKRQEPEMRVLDLSDPDTVIPLHRPRRSKVFNDHLFNNFLALWIARIVERDIATDESH